MSRFIVRPGTDYEAVGDQTWRRSAACGGDDLALFYGPDGERAADRETREARAIDRCWSCPVRTECLEDALIPANTKQYGVRGGMTAEERIVVRRNRMRRAKAQLGRAA
ncbi:WhiB family transcriptional regulator [Nocardiopsis eucommiae]|uniref:WhiB family transcriptional regulator n=1 Tax=Nocardiopsis eucommiae TaxID=2831970 RepID=UPI003D70F080